MRTDRKEILKRYREKNRELLKLKAMEYRDDNKEDIRQKNKEYKIKNRDSILLKSKEYRNKNKDKAKDYKKKYYNTNSENIKQKNKEYRYNNKEKIRLYKVNRKNNDPLFKLSLRIGSMIKNAVRFNNSRKLQTKEILGCSYEEFKLYLENKFELWMNWSNHGKWNGDFNYGWDIDHIIPLSTGNTEEEIIKLNHYTNLQPLCSQTNRYIKKDNPNY